MKTTEALEIRKEMVDMHDFFLKKIDEAMDANNYIEATWLIYSCLENRYFRVLLKYKSLCKYCKGDSKCKKKRNELAISTKISCVKRLHKHGVSCISESFVYDLFDRTKKWVKKRNDLMHDLLSLETYQDAYDNKFKELSVEGKTILQETYAACTMFRGKFFTEGYHFVFPEECMDECPCAPRDKKENEDSTTNDL